MSVITECPICGAELQLTEVREVWFTLSLATVKDGEIERLPDEAGEVWEGEDDIEVRIYCANDHTSKEMAAALKEEIS